MIDGLPGVSDIPNQNSNQTGSAKPVMTCFALSLDDWRFLHQGGLTGYAPREYLATMFSECIVQENQAFAWNPAIYGIKSEDTILVGVNENKFLTHTGN
ncbi:MAG: hypothetical protein ACOY35_01135 [Bacillota bacterium]